MRKPVSRRPRSPRPPPARRLPPGGEEGVERRDREQRGGEAGWAEAVHGGAGEEWPGKPTQTEEERVHRVGGHQLQSRKRSPTSVSPTVNVAPIEPPHATTTHHSASAAGDHHGPAAPGSSHGEAIQEDASAFVHSSTEIPGTRSSSSVFTVTTVRSRDRACPVITGMT